MNSVNEAMKDTMEKIRQMVDVNAVVGEPITTPDGTTLLPVSKVTFGFAAGGTDGTNLRFGAGSGAAVSVTPMAFIVVSQGNVRMIYVEPPTNSTVDKLVDMVPPAVEKLTQAFKKDKPAAPPEGTSEV